MIGWLLRLLLLVLIVRALWKLAVGLIEGVRRPHEVGRGAQAPTRRRGPQQAVPLVKDPVCGTYVVRERAITSGTGAEQQHFCSDACRDAWVRRGEATRRRA